MRTSDCIFSPDLEKLITYSLSFTSNSIELSFEDFVHEVKYDLWNNSRESDYEISSIVIAQTKWTLLRLIKEKYRGRKEIVWHGRATLDETAAIDAKDAVEKILECPELSEQERSLLACYAAGDTRDEILAKLGFKSRQRLEQVKKTAFFKIRTLYAS